MGKQHRYTYIKERGSSGGVAVVLYKNGMLLYSELYTGWLGIAHLRAYIRVSQFRRIYNASAA